MYMIIHRFDKDGGFGDGVRVEKNIGYVETEEEAKAYCAKWDKTRISYGTWFCGILTYREIKHAPKNPWEGTWVEDVLEGKELDPDEIR